MTGTFNFSVATFFIWYGYHHCCLLYQTQRYRCAERTLPTRF